MKTPISPDFPIKNSPEAQALTPRYSQASITMHWLMVLLFVGIFAAANLVDAFPEDSPAQQTVLALHFSLGLLVFALVWLRLALRLLGTTPPIVPNQKPWQHAMSVFVHWLLYGLMVAMPLLGWAGLPAVPWASRLCFSAGWCLPCSLPMRPWVSACWTCMSPWGSWRISWWVAMPCWPCCTTTFGRTTRCVACCRVRHSWPRCLK